ncbi:MAG: hypothetical protein IH969_08970, partial [Candidatus Krumholzibacteriota bacterium]|nr:hypothetical protein [Candidatus Krumholzibacteriota bacterium]
TNFHGMGASPILADGKVFMVVDQDIEAHVIAVRAGDGGLDGLGSQSLQRAVEDVQGHVWFLSDAQPQNISIGWHGINIYNPANDEWLTISPDTRSDMADGDVVDVAFGLTFTYIALRNWGIQPWTHGGFNWTDLTSSPCSDLIDSRPLRVGVTDELPDVKLAALALRSDGILWIATEGDGLYKWDGGITPPKHIPGFTGIGTGVLSPKVAAIALDHDENLWVATSSGLNRIARDDDNDITAFSTPAEYQRSLITLGYPFDVITPLVHENCQSLAVHPTLDVLYI